MNCTMSLAFGLAAALTVHSTFAIDVKGVEVDFATRLKTPADLTCVRMSSQPRDARHRACKRVNNLFF